MADEPEDSKLEDTPPERDEESSGTSEEIEEEKPSGREEEKPESPETSKDEGKPDKEEESEADLKARYTKSTQELAEIKRQNELLRQEVLRRQPPPTTQPKSRLDLVSEKHKLDAEVIRDVAGAITETWKEQQQEYNNRMLGAQIETEKKVQWKEFKEHYPEFPEDQREELDRKMNEIALENPKMLDSGNAYAKTMRFMYAENPDNFKGIIQAAEKRAEERAKKKKSSEVTKLGRDAKAPEEKKDEEAEAVDQLFGKSQREYE